MLDRTLNILTVDDELPITWSIRFALSSPGRTFASAGNGEEALARVAPDTLPFDVIITDHNMPRVNGLELVRRLRERSFAGKIIVISAHLSCEVRQAYEALWVDRVLAKPFDTNELRAAVDEIVLAA